MAKILIPDYQGQHIVAGIKSLSKNGDTCDLAWKLNTYDKFFKSKYISKIFDIPVPGEDDKGYISAIIEILKKYNYDLLIPFGNKACRAITINQKEIRKYTRLFVPSVKSHNIAYDKTATHEHCKNLGVRTPATYYVIDKVNLKNISQEINYPCVIKPRGLSGDHINPLYASNSDELIFMFDSYLSIEKNNSLDKVEPPIIQEYIPGFIHDACLIADKGSIVNILTQVRHLMYPISGGVGAINYTTKNQEIIEITKKLIESLQWTGPAQVEFKYDKRTHTYYLIEINPKFWGTLDLSIQSGIDFPVMIRDILLGQQLEKTNYDVGNYYYFLFPQATCASMQSLKINRFNSIRSDIKKQKIFFDIDVFDIKPLIIRIFKTIFLLISGNFMRGIRKQEKYFGKRNINSS